MATAKRSTNHSDPELHRAPRLKAAATEAVEETLFEDATDLEAFKKRRREPSLNFEDVILKLRRSRKI